MLQNERTRGAEQGFVVAVIDDSDSAAEVGTLLESTDELNDFERIGLRRKLRGGQGNERKSRKAGDSVFQRTSPLDDDVTDA